MKTHDNKMSGFTMIEMMAVLSTTGLLLSLGIPSYGMIRNNIGLSNDVREIANVLELAQSRSIVSQGGVRHGVYFSQDGYTLFEGEWSAPAVKSEYRLKNGIKVYDAAGTTVNFERFTGDTASTTITIGSSASNIKKIIIGQTGNINIQ